MSMQIIDSERIKELSDIDEDGSNSTLKELIQMYLENMPQKISDLKKLLEDKNYSELKKLAHFIRSSSLSFGAEKLSSIAFNIEYAKENFTHDEFSRHIFELENAFVEVKKELEKY
jgi:HPt (histidine-containing phosphotransfer) domain-containing protein